MKSSFTIYVEGLDLAGKSTMCRFLRDKLGAEHRHNSLITDNPLYQRAEGYRKDDSLPTEALGWIYYGALAVDLLKYRKPQGPIVQDSTILTRSVALHRTFGNQHLADQFEALADCHPQFDVAVRPEVDFLDQTVTF